MLVLVQKDHKLLGILAENIITIIHILLFSTCTCVIICFALDIHLHLKIIALHYIINAHHPACRIQSFDVRNHSFAPTLDQFFPIGIKDSFAKRLFSNIDQL